MKMKSLHFIFICTASLEEKSILASALLSARTQRRVSGLSEREVLIDHTEPCHIRRRRVRKC